MCRPVKLHDQMVSLECFKSSTFSLPTCQITGLRESNSRIDYIISISALTCLYSSGIRHFSRTGLNGIGVVWTTQPGLLVEEGEIEQGIWLFTNESYNRMKHVDERLADRVVKARTSEDNHWVFAIGSDFIKDTAEGQFDNTVIITIGCYCLYVDDLVQAFIKVPPFILIGMVRFSWTAWTRQQPI